MYSGRRLSPNRLLHIARRVKVFPIQLGCCRHQPCSEQQTPAPCNHLVLHHCIQLDWTPSRRTQKVNSPTNQKGYGNSKTTIGKLSARRIQICVVYFCVIHFWLLFQNMWKQGPNKNTYTRQNQILLVKYSCAPDSGPPEVPRFVWELIFLVISGKLDLHS